jgi:hypothetical protein
MGLKKLAPGQKKAETPTATWDELLAFRKAAVKFGYASLATAALTAWEWLQREEHLFGVFEISHYRPKARPNSVCVVHPKTGEEAWWRSARQLPTYAKRTRKQLVSGTQKTPYRANKTSRFVGMTAKNLSE